MQLTVPGDCQPLKQATYSTDRIVSTFNNAFSCNDDTHMSYES